MRLLAAIAFLVGIGAAIAFADLENQQRGGEAGVFTSKPDRLRLVVPRSWYATEQASYPGMLLWMRHPQPEAHMVLTAEPFTRKLYCSWPIPCRTSHDALPNKLACALSSQLKGQKLHVGPVQAGPKENEEAGMPTVWFEFDDGHRFERQAVAVTEDRIVSLVLATSSTDARTSYVRAFEQALRTLRPLTAAELVVQGTPAAAPADAAPADTGTLADAAVAQPTMAIAVQTAPTPKINPVGDCSAAR